MRIFTVGTLYWQYFRDKAGDIVCVFLYILQTSSLSGRLGYNIVVHYHSKQLRYTNELSLLSFANRIDNQPAKHFKACLPGY